MFYASLHIFTALHYLLFIHSFCGVLRRTPSNNYSSYFSCLCKSLFRFSEVTQPYTFTYLHYLFIHAFLCPSRYQRHLVITILILIPVSVKVWFLLRFLVVTFYCPTLLFIYAFILLSYQEHLVIYNYYFYSSCFCKSLVFCFGFQWWRNLMKPELETNLWWWEMMSYLNVWLLASPRTCWTS